MRGLSERVLTTGGIIFSASVHSGLYVKTVLRDELDEAYSIDTIATYKGREYLVLLEESGKYCIQGGRQEDLMISLGFNYTEDRGVYRKWVDKNDLTSIHERKTSI